MNYENPPCRICGIKREPHENMFIDHRFRPVYRCSASCDRPATWYVDGVALCSAHKGNALRVVHENGLEEPRLRHIYKG